MDAHDTAAVQQTVEALEGAARPITASTLLVHVPRTRLRDLAAASAVRYVEASVRLKPHTDRAHRSAGLIRTGSARTVPQRGAGVLVGVIDTGIDTTHPAFKNGGLSRIVQYLDQTPDPDVTFDSAAINGGLAAAAPDEIGHGTHVAGIAAGNGGGSTGGAFAGVAPEADLAIVKTTFDSAEIADAIRHIFDLATQRNQPCVVNLSLGGHIGGHDGTTVTERTIDQLSGPGRLVVVSAGNEGRDQIHASTMLPSGQATPARWVANFSLERQQLQGQLVGLIRVQVWHQREDALAIRLRAPNGEFIQPPANNEVEVDRGVFVVQASHQVAPYSGDHVTTFLIITDPVAQWLSGWSIVVEEVRTGGAAGVVVGPVHAWIQDSAMGHFTTGQAQSYLIGMPGTAYSAITVASYATRDQWPSTGATGGTFQADAVTLEDISYFSSMGPARDGDTKPEICAPGQWLIAPLSAQASEDEMPRFLRLPGEKYAALQGTSMAAPYVTGALALLLEKEGSIDWAEAKRRLIKSARQDGQTAACWNPRWGYGKLDLERLLTIEP